MDRVLKQLGEGADDDGGGVLVDRIKALLVEPETEAMTLAQARPGGFCPAIAALAFREQSNPRQPPSPAAACS